MSARYAASCSSIALSQSKCTHVGSVQAVYNAKWLTGMSERYFMKSQQDCNTLQQTYLVLFGRPNPAQLLLCVCDLPVAFQVADLPALLHDVTWS